MSGGMRDDGCSGFLPGFAETALGAGVDVGVFHGTPSPSVAQSAGRSLTHAPFPDVSLDATRARAPRAAVVRVNRRMTTRVNPEPTQALLAPTALEPFRLHNGDAVAWLRQLPSESVDLLITDPPYESLEKHRAIGTTTRLKHSKASSNDWFQIFPNSRFAELFTEVHRVLARNSHFYLYCDPETMFVAKPIAERCGFKFWKPLVWDKRKIGMGYHYRARYEFILFFEKGKRKLNDLGIPDVIECPRIRNGYPTEKPVSVSEVLVQQSSLPGQLVVDPFMGSASVGEAALIHQRRFMGSDVSPTALELSRTRLERVVADTAARDSDGA